MSALPSQFSRRCSVTSTCVRGAPPCGAGAACVSRSASCRCRYRRRDGSARRRAFGPAGSCARKGTARNGNAHGPRYGGGTTPPERSETDGARSPLPRERQDILPASPARARVGGQRIPLDQHQDGRQYPMSRSIAPPGGGSQSSGRSGGSAGIRRRIGCRIPRSCGDCVRVRPLFATMPASTRWCASSRTIGAT